jgi:hypothetical protein
MVLHSRTRPFVCSRLYSEDLSNSERKILFYPESVLRMDTDIKWNWSEMRACYFDVGFEVSQPWLRHLLRAGRDVIYSSETSVYFKNTRCIPEDTTLHTVT